MLYEWNEAGLSTYSNYSFGSLQVEGDFAIFNRGNSLYRKEFTTSKATKIAESVGASFNSVSALGKVVFWDLDRQIKIYENSVIDNLPVVDNSHRLNVRADISGYLYTKCESTCWNRENQAVAFHNGIEEVLLTDYQSERFAISSVDYKISEN